MRVRELRRGMAGLAWAAVIAAVAAGCGIRPTVPVDAGAAPSRMPCSLSRDAEADEDGQGVPVTVYLVCASGLEAVQRAAGPALTDPKGSDGRLPVARALLAQLTAEPSADERQAGFLTYVQPPLTVSAGREGDPAGTLRLSRQPDDLPPAALSQLVCTYAENGATAAGGGTVVLGGPGDYPARRYTCTTEVKERPDSAVPTGSSRAATPAA
ncbi:hypothetical protein ACF1G0_12840 [Streptomyces sp. NPDC013953]|uniref:hypothetical protein n=1 Tax=Streptomyces sp. NPDC013953 TaxID=3364868 RepID=UPI0036FE194C